MNRGAKITISILYSQFENRDANKLFNVSGPTMSQADKEKYQKDATSCRNIECALNKCENWDKCKPCLEKTKKFCQEEYPDTTPQHCWMNHLMNC